MRSVLNEDNKFDADDDLSDPPLSVNTEKSVGKIIVADELNLISTQPKPPTCTATEDKVQCPSCNKFFHCSDIEAHADSCAENNSIRNEVFEQFYDDNVFQTVINEDNSNCSNEESNSEKPLESNGMSVKDIVKHISKQILPTTSRINVRRGRLFDDYVETR